MKERRRVYFRKSGPVEVAVYDRYHLNLDASIPGPAIVEEEESTTVVPDGWALTLDGDWNLRIRRAQS
jgi:N-methylhydantoinase A/oxoprolinase/acetone carboxylase beta subunit